MKTADSSFLNTFPTNVVIKPIKQTIKMEFPNTKNRFWIEKKKIRLSDEVNLEIGKSKLYVVVSGIIHNKFFAVRFDCADNENANIKDGM